LKGKSGKDASADRSKSGIMFVVYPGTRFSPQACRLEKPKRILW
jgi:hypothetical protein